MREIEIKLRVKSYSVTRNKLITNGWTSIETLHQADFIYLKEGMNFASLKKGTPVIRLRVQNSKQCFLNVKVSQSSELDCIEHETLVDNAIETRKIIQQLGLKEVIKVSKTREIGTLGNYTLCLDNVDGLGCFIELETLVEDETMDMDSLRKEMIGDLEKLDLDIENEVNVGYDTLIFKSVKNHE